MIAALRYELLRITTIRSTYWLSALAVLLSAALSVILALVVNATVPQDLTRPELTTWVVTSGASAFGMPIVAAVFFAVMGALAMGHEYRYGTAKATLMANPRRVSVLAAKAVVVAAWVVAGCVLVLVVNVGLAALLLDEFDLAAEALRPMAAFVGYCVGFALAGLSLAALFRNQTGAIVMVLVWPLVIEVVVLTVMRALRLEQDLRAGELYNLLPAAAGRRTMFDLYALFASLDNANAGAWGLGVSAAIFWAAIAGLLALATVLFVRRDA